MTGRVTALTVHQGCGLTNAMTGIAEAAKSRTPLLVLAAEATAPSSNFYVDQDGLARAVGAIPARISSAEAAVDEALAAMATALHQRRTVLLNLPLEIQSLDAPDISPRPLPARPAPAAPSADDMTRLVQALETARRPVFVAGRGARPAGYARAVVELAQQCGALLATSAVAKGLFHDQPWSLDVSGGFSAPTTATGRWSDVPYADSGTGGRIDPRTLSLRLDKLLPTERVVGVDSGNFMGYPSMFLSVPDEEGFCLTQAFQSIGLGLATTIGAALARPDRLAVAALGDGGCLMAAAELDTVVRLGLLMVVIVYNDDAYGAEVHHFGPDGYPLDTVQFPPTDIAAIARGHGFTAVTVTREADLAPVGQWLAGDRQTPLLIDAKVTRGEPAWWLEEAFRGH